MHMYTHTMTVIAGENIIVPKLYHELCLCIINDTYNSKSVFVCMYMHTYIERSSLENIIVPTFYHELCLYIMDDMYI